MHSLESLREIRNLKYLFVSRETQEANYDRRANETPVHEGEVIAVAKYNLETRVITVKRLPKSADSEAHK